MTSLLDRYTADELHALVDQDDPDLNGLLDQALDQELHDWTRWARTKQLAPEGDWLIWLLVTGRRWGKTRAAAEWLRTRSLDTVGSYGICAPTYGDVRDVCVEQGTPARPSGFLSVCRPGEIDNYNRSLGEIRMTNGSKIKMLSADEPDRARGWGFVSVWCDELSSWRRPATWHETLLPATTMADRHRFVVTTTPKPNRLTIDLITRAQHDPAVVLIRGHTRENAANLGQGAVDELERTMTGRLARQELEGELLLDVPGALWTLDTLDRHRVSEFPDLERLVVAIDPAVTDTDESDESGIVAVGRTGDTAYVIEDVSGRYSPHDAMTRVAALWRDLSADQVIVEGNNGGDYLPALLRTIDPSIPSLKVSATRGKETRAQPVAALYEHGRVRHVGMFPELEEQLTGWAPGAGRSPDRLDALVWAVTALFPELDTGPGRKLRSR